MLFNLSAKGKEEAERELSSTIQEFVIGAGQNTDDASVGILYLPDTKVPDFSAINDSKERFDRNHEDTIRSVQMEWVPKVKHAQEILSAISAGKPVENVSKAAVSEDEPSEKKQPEEETEKVTQGDNSKEEGEEKTTLPSEGKSRKTVPLWLFLLMSGAFIATAVGLILQLI